MCCTSGTVMRGRKNMRLQGPAKQSADGLPTGVLGVTGDQVGKATSSATGQLEYNATIVGRVHVAEGVPCRNDGYAARLRGWNDDLLHQRRTAVRGELPPPTLAQGLRRPHDLAAKLQAAEVTRPKTTGSGRVAAAR